MGYCSVMGSSSPFGGCVVVWLLRGLSSTRCIISFPFLISLERCPLLSGIFPTEMLKVGRYIFCSWLYRIVRNSRYNLPPVTHSLTHFQDIPLGSFPSKSSFYKHYYIMPIIHHTQQGLKHNIGQQTATPAPPSTSHPPTATPPRVTPREPRISSNT